jgi:hypothetical protein
VPRPAPTGPAKITFHGRNGSGDVDITLGGAIRVTQGRVSPTHADLIIDGVDPGTRIEQILDVTKFGSPVRTMRIYRDPNNPTRVYISLSLLAPVTPTVKKTSSGVQWHVEGTDMA